MPTAEQNLGAWAAVQDDAHTTTTLTRHDLDQAFIDEQRERRPN